MTAIIFSLAPNQVIVASDTLAVAGGTYKPFFFTTKFYPLPHLHGVMFATGLGDLASEWFSNLERFLVRDIQHLDEYVTSSLRLLGKSFGLDDHQTATIYHIGYSESDDQYIGFAYRSLNNFESEKLVYGIHTKPGVLNAEIKSYPEDFIKVMKNQKYEDEALPIEDRVFIGGEIQSLMMENKITTISTLYRFEEYELLYKKMCDLLPANC